MLLKLMCLSWLRSFSLALLVGNEAPNAWAPWAATPAWGGMHPASPRPYYPYHHGPAYPFGMHKSQVSPVEHNVPPTKALRVVMEPGGAYGKNAASQLAYLNLLRAGILSAIKQGSVIYDLGCADGFNSLGLLHDIHNITSDFTVGFVDLPENDWATVRRQVGTQIKTIFPKNTGTLREVDINSIRANPGPKAILIGKSFYAQLAPEASVNVAFSSTAVQYLSQNVPKSKRTERAQSDWLNFLQNRQKELVPGASLHVTGLATYYEGASPGEIWNLMDGVLNESIHKGWITHQQRQEWTWPGYPRTEDEWHLPFTLNQVPGLTMEKFNIIILDSPYWKKARGNPRAFAGLYVPSAMAWLGAYVSTSLELRVRDLLEWRLKQRVMAKPEAFKKDFMQAVMTIRRNNMALSQAEKPPASLPDDFKPEAPSTPKPIELEPGETIALQTH